MKKIEIKEIDRKLNLHIKKNKEGKIVSIFSNKEFDFIIDNRLVITKGESYTKYYRYKDNTYGNLYVEIDIYSSKICNQGTPFYRKWSYGYADK